MIVNYGYLGMVVNLAPNYGVQAGVILAGGAGVPAGGVTGLVVNYSLNLGSQAGVFVN